VSSRTPGPLTDQGRHLLPHLVLGLDLLLLLDYGPGFLGSLSNHFAGVLVVIRQPQPDLRHVVKSDPRFAVFKCGRLRPPPLGTAVRVGTRLPCSPRSTAPSVW
jgi:hypothetical protein